MCVFGFGKCGCVWGWVRGVGFGFVGWFVIRWHLEA